MRKISFRFDFFSSMTRTYNAFTKEHTGMIGVL